MVNVQARSCLVIIGALAASSAMAQMPRTISYQGVIANAAGVPLPNGNHKLVLSIYDQSAGGGVLFSETQTVPVVNGVFNVIIGSATNGGIPTSLAFDRQYWLGIAIDDGQELAPRTHLTSSPYSFGAMWADTARSVAANAINANAIQNGAITLSKLNIVGSTAGQVLASTGTGVAWRNLSQLGVSTLNGQMGDVEILAGNNMVVTKNGNKLTLGTINSGKVGSVNSADGAILVTNPEGPGVGLSIVPGGITEPLVGDAAISTAKLKNGSVTSEKIVDGTIATVDIANEAVTSAKIADGTVVTADLSDGAVTLAKLAPDAVNSAKIADGTVATVDLADGAITTAKIADGSVTGSKIPDGSITTAKLADAAVTTVKIADGSVTDAKIANGISYSKLTGAPTSLPPSGAAAGDLTGTYPNPTVAADAITSAKIADGSIVNADVNAAAAIAYSKLNLNNSIVTGDLTNGSVTTVKLADSAVTSLKLGTAAVNTAHVADAAITDAKIANGISYSKLTGAPTSLPPSGAAAGDLTGTYPNPTVAAGAITSAKIADGSIVNADVNAAAAIAYSKLNLNNSIVTSDLTDGSVTDAKIANGISYLKLTGAPTSLPPSGAAAGDLTGTYPNPTVAANAITSAKIADGAITNADVNVAAGIVYSKLSLTNSIVTSDLTNGSVTTAKLADSAVSGLKLGTFAVNTAHIADGSVTDAKVANGISYSKLSGAPTSLPPSGAAGGDLTGTFPNPTVAAGAITSAKIADGAITNADVNVAAGIVYSKLALTNSIVTSDLTNGSVTSSKLADSAVSGLKLGTFAVNTAHIADGAVTDAKVANGISYSKLSGAPTSLPPSGAAGGDLTGTFPNPTVAANAITSAKIADGTITNADISAAAAISYSKLNLTGSIQGSDIAAGTFTSTNSHRALGNNDNVARELRLLEPSGSGVNYTAFKAQAQAGDITYTLPNAAPTAANQVLQVQAVAGNNATLSWGAIGGNNITFARTGVIANAGNTSYNVQASDDIVGIDMSAGTNFTVNLPPATTAGEILIVKIEKYNNATLPILTVQPNGTNKIDGFNNDAFGNAGGSRSYYSDGAGNWYSW